MKTISRFPKLILLGVVSLGLGAAVIYAIPALATSFGDDVAVSKRLILNSSNQGLLNPDQFQIFSGDTPLVRLHQDTTGICPLCFPEQIWDLQANESAMYFYDITGGGKRPFTVYTGAPTDSLVVRSSGNVGIGTAGPAEKLHVVGGSIMTEGTGGTGRVVIKGTGVGGHQYEWYPDSPAVGDLQLYDRTSGGSPIVFKSSGNVGIGTSDPGQKLDVSGIVRTSTAFLGTNVHATFGTVCYSGLLTPGTSSAALNLNNCAGNGKVAINVCSIQSSNGVGNHAYDVFMAAHGQSYNDYGTALLVRATDGALRASRSGAICTFTNSSAGNANYVIKQLPITALSATLGGY